MCCCPGTNITLPTHPIYQRSALAHGQMTNTTLSNRSAPLPGPRPPHLAGETRPASLCLAIAAAYPLPPTVAVLAPPLALQLPQGPVRPAQGSRGYTCPLDLETALPTTPSCSRCPELPAQTTHRSARCLAAPGRHLRRLPAYPWPVLAPGSRRQPPGATWAALAHPVSRRQPRCRISAIPRSLLAAQSVVRSCQNICRQQPAG